MISVYSVVLYFFCMSMIPSTITGASAPNGIVPSVAINCNMLPFYVDLKTGKWIADTQNGVVCDTYRKEVLSYCQKRYPKQKVTEVFPADKSIRFYNWCRSKSGECSDAKQVVPYKCLNVRHKKGFSYALRSFKEDMPFELEECDRRSYRIKKNTMRYRHQNKVSATVKEKTASREKIWKLKSSLNRTSFVEKQKEWFDKFEKAFARLREEAEKEKVKFREEQLGCLERQLTINKRNAMLTYGNIVESKPRNIRKIMGALRMLVQACEEERQHILRHYNIVRRTDSRKASILFYDLLLNLKFLGITVRKGIDLLDYLPAISENDVAIKSNLQPWLDDFYKSFDD